MTQTPMNIVLVDGPPCHVETVAVRSTLQQGVQHLAVVELLGLLARDVRFYTVADQPLPGTIGHVEGAVCPSCGAQTIRSRAGTVRDAQLDSFRRFGFDAA